MRKGSSFLRRSTRWLLGRIRARSEAKAGRLASLGYQVPPAGPARRAFLFGLAGMMAATAAAAQSPARLATLKRPAVNFVTGFQVNSDVSYSVTNPYPTTALVPMDGFSARITVNNGAIACDPTKVWMDVEEPTWDPVTLAPAGTARRRIRGKYHYAGPYNEYTVKPGGSSFDITFNSRIYNANELDSTGRNCNSVVVAVGFDAGFTTGSAAGVLPALVPVVRNDTSKWPITNFRHLTDPHRINSGTLDYELGVVSRFARDGKQVKGVQAWAVSGGADGIGGTTGPVGTATDMTISVNSPAGNPTATMGESALRACVYRVPVAIGSLSDTADPNNPADGVVFRVVPHIGPDTFSTDIGDAWIGTGITPNLPKCLPMIINQSGKYNRRYLWVKPYGGAAGASPAVQTTSADPGATADYALWKTAVDAGIAHNVARGHPAGSMTGLVIMLRDIAGSVRGANDDGAGNPATYNPGGGSLWTSTTNYRGMLEVIRASQIANINTPHLAVRSNACRLRGVDKTGANTPAKATAPKVRWIGIEFDSTGTNDTAYHPTTNPNAANIITSAGGSSATTPTLYVNQPIQVFYGCRDESNSRTAALNAGLYGGMGHLYEFQHAHPTAVPGQGHDRMEGVVVSVGSFYDCANLNAVSRENGVVPQTGLAAVWIYGGGFAGQGLTYSTTPAIKGGVIISVRCDGEKSAANMWFHLERLNGANPLGLGVCGLLLIRRNQGTAGLSGPAAFLAGDQTRYTLKNYVIQHFASAAYNSPGAARVNGPYNDTGAFSIVQDVVFQNSALHALIMKSGFFNDPVTPQGQNDGANNTANAYAQGAVTHDGNATVSARIYKGAIRDVPAGISFSDTSYWVQVPNATPTTAYGPQPRRNGNNAPRCAVDWHDSVAGTFVGGQPGEFNGSWYINVRPDGSLTEWGQSDANGWFANDTSGLATTDFSQIGDFRPKVGSELRNKVQAGHAKVPYDPYGVARPNDGTGATGWAEAA